MSDQESVQEWSEWIGRTEVSSDVASAAPVAMMSATLDRADAPCVVGDEVPALWHWLFFTPRARQSEIGADGHAKRGDFLPPIPLPRRMWAGGRLDFHHLLKVGDAVARKSQIAAVSSKHGRSGRLAFVTVRHEISDAAGLAITEEHDIVYRDAATPGEQATSGLMAPTDEQFSRVIVPDPVLLFRYSALTFNGHRIHYDRKYAETVEQYPGLIVHGPLIATLLLDLLRREKPALRVTRFVFKGVRPLFDLTPFVVCGRVDSEHQVTLWAKDHLGQLAMQATADFT